jgi:cobalamin biosynthesis protein CobT
MREELKELSPEEQNAERAVSAVKAFRGMLPGLNGFARAITRNPHVRIRISPDPTPSTDGTNIFFRPPIALGNSTPHNRRLCGRRDANGQLLCEACLTKEDVLVDILHETAHIANDSFAKTTEYDQLDLLQKALALYPKFEDRIRKNWDKIPDEIKNDYKGLCTLINPFLPSIHNALDDARIDSTMFRARKGTRKMFNADVWRIFNEPVIGDDGIELYPRDCKPHTQLMIGLYFAACQYNFDGWFEDSIDQVLRDEELTKLITQAKDMLHVRQIYELSFQVLDRLNQLGYFRLPEMEDQEEQQPPPLQGGDDNDDESEDGELDASGDARDEEAGPPDSSERQMVGEGEQSDLPMDMESNQNGSEEGSKSDSLADQQGDERSPEQDDAPASDQQPGEESPGEQSSDNKHESGEQDGIPGQADSDSSSDEQGHSSNDQSRKGEDVDATPGDSSNEDHAESTLAEPGPDANEDHGSSEVRDRPGGDGVAEGGPVGDLPTRGGDLLVADGDPSEREDLAAPDMPDTHSQNEESTDDVEPAGSSAPDREDAEETAPIDTGPYGPDGGVHQADLGEPSELTPIQEAIHNHGAFIIIQTDQENNAMSVAVIQGQYFEKPSQEIWGVHEHRYHQHVYDDEGSDQSMAWEWWANQSKRVRKGGGVLPVEDMTVPEDIIGQALAKMRRVFHDNKMVKHIRNQKKGKVDGRVLGRRAPFNDPRIMQRKRKPKKKNYKVIIGIDISGSTYGEEIMLAKRAAMAQAELLNRTGVDFAIMAHTATPLKGGIDEWMKLQLEDDWNLVLDIYIIKDFGEPWNNETKSHLCEMGSVADNLDGHSIEFYRRHIEKQPEEVKIIMYYSDGAMPAANYEEELEVLQREIKTCRRKGITLMGVGIRTDSPAQHGLDTYQVDTDEDLPGVVDHLEKVMIR